MNNLEVALRLMTQPSRHMDLDLADAIQDTKFFEDGDTIVELDSSEVMVHSSILCQRCAFFKGLFKGRAEGQWLAGRRQNASEAVRVDLKHIAPDSFRLVLRFLYADVGPELFDDVVAIDIDEFSDLVMGVMGVANELLLNRLAQVCQQVLGRFGELILILPGSCEAWPNTPIIVLSSVTEIYYYISSIARIYSVIELIRPLGQSPFLQFSRHITWLIPPQSPLAMYASSSMQFLLALSRSLKIRPSSTSVCS